MSAHPGSPLEEEREPIENSASSSADIVHLWLILRDARCVSLKPLHRSETKAGLVVNFQRRLFGFAHVSPEAPGSPRHRKVTGIPSISANKI